MVSPFLGFRTRTPSLRRSGALHLRGPAFTTLRRRLRSSTIAARGPRSRPDPVTPGPSDRCRDRDERCGGPLCSTSNTSSPTAIRPGCDTAALRRDVRRICGVISRSTSDLAPGGIQRRHRAARAQGIDADCCVAYAQLGTLHVLSASPSTPETTMLGRNRRTSRPNAAIAPSVATSSGKTSKRSGPAAPQLGVVAGRSAHQPESVALSHAWPSINAIPRRPAWHEAQ